MPRTLGDSFLYVYDIDMLVPADAPLIEVQAPEPDADNAPDRRIHRRPGRGRLDGRVRHRRASRRRSMQFLKDKKDLGIHTEMFTDSIIDLIESGAVDRQRASRSTGARSSPASAWAPSGSTTTSTTTRCSRSIRPSTSTTRSSSPSSTRWSPSTSPWRSTSPARSAPTRSARGSTPASAGRSTSTAAPPARRAARRSSPCPSTAKDGTLSRIVTRLSPGAGVVTTRGDVHYVVTEYGVAYLHGKSVQERAIALISIAHPKFRDQLLQGGHRGQVPAPGAGATSRASSSSGPRRFRTTHLLERRHADQLPPDPPDRRIGHASTCSTRCRRKRSTTASCRA